MKNVGNDGEKEKTTFPVLGVQKWDFACLIAGAEYGRNNCPSSESFSQASPSDCGSEVCLM